MEAKGSTGCGPRFQTALARAKATTSVDGPVPLDASLEAFSCVRELRASMRSFEEQAAIALQLVVTEFFQPAHLRTIPSLAAAEERAAAEGESSEADANSSIKGAIQLARAIRRSSRLSGEVFLAGSLVIVIPPQPAGGASMQTDSAAYAADVAWELAVKDELMCATRLAAAASAPFSVPLCASVEYLVSPAAA